MSEPQLLVRSAKARDLAYRLARRENRTVVEVVERALEAYDLHEANKEPARDFYRRLVERAGTDIDLDAILREERKLHSGIDL